ncbi:unnamed protein product [Prunus armeniaca]
MLTLPTLASSQGQDHFIQLPRGPIRTGTGRNFKLKTGQNLGFQFGSKTQNRSKPTPQSARARKKEKKPHLVHRNWTAETTAQCREESDLNQSELTSGFEVSGGEMGWVVIGASRRVERNRCRFFPLPELRESKREKERIGERETEERECTREREKVWG